MTTPFLSQSSVKNQEFKTCKFCKKIFLRPKKISQNHWDEQQYCNRTCGNKGRLPDMEDASAWIKHLLSKTSVGENGCIEKIKAKKRSGYSTSKYNDKYIPSHRLMYLLVYGDIPTGYQVCHRCDNPSCINIDHLFLGTVGDNARDKIAKGRGKPFGRDQININTVKQLLGLAMDGVQYKDIAKELELNKSTVASIARRNGIRRHCPRIKKERDAPKL